MNLQKSKALISCTNKTHLASFARFLVKHNIELLSTGGTAKTLRDENIPVTDIGTYTGFEEILDGRVKTLQPKIHGGILQVHDNAEHQKQVLALGIPPIDWVIVNLYEFENTIAKPNVTFEDAIENIDIGGPALLRSAAKNHKFVTVISDPNDYTWIEEEFEKNKSLSFASKQKLALKAFQTTAHYDTAISGFLSKTLNAPEQGLSQNLSLHFSKSQDLRYGENPHQKAALYLDHTKGVANAKRLQGKELSFNNLLDAESAHRLALEFTEPVCVIVKHNNPCGVALDNSLTQAFLKAKACDPTSSFGGVMAFNRTIEADLAHEIVASFFEVILAPDFSKESLEIFSKKPSWRLLALKDFKTQALDFDFKKIGGGLLVQETDTKIETLKTQAQVVTAVEPSEAQYRDLEFVWKVAKHVKSNAIVFGRNGQTLGIGAGQMSRIDSTRLAKEKAKEAFSNPDILKGSALASDAFFPFQDGLVAALEAGATSVVQPGGSVRDNEVIAAANEKKVPMLFTGVRHFRH